MKNNTARNVGILGAHNKAGGMPFSVMVAAGSTLELSDDYFDKISLAASKLEAVGVITFVVPRESKLTKDEIIAKVMLEADVLLKDSMKKSEMQEMATKLGVAL